MRIRFSLPALAALALAITLALPPSPAAAYQAVQIDATGFSRCALAPEQTVECWGQNHHGQLGNGTYENSLVPVAVTDLPGQIDSISLGANGTACAVTSGGALYCWGNNNFGQLASGSTEATSPVPVLVSDFEVAIESVSVGANFSCAIAEGGSLYCWGINADGQLGNGTNENSDVPILVTGMGAITSVTAGLQTACGVDSEGAAYCWGSGYHGTLGNGGTEDSAVPVPVNSLDSGVVSVDLATRIACALMDTAAIYCWGSSARLGNGSNAGSLIPVQVTSLGQTVALVSCASDHACVVTDDAALLCWGANYTGQTDPTNEDDFILSPTPLESFAETVSSTSTGDTSNCAITTEGEALCWGENGSGQLGNGTTEDALVPTPVPEPGAGLGGLAALLTLAGWRRGGAANSPSEG